IHQAREEVRAQIRLRERLKLGCVRLESKLQRGVTTLEKLHLTLTQHASNRVDDAALKDAFSNLEVFADEVHYQNLSVEELCALDVFDEQAPQFANAQFDAGLQTVFSSPAVPENYHAAGVINPKASLLTQAIRVIKIAINCYRSSARY